MSLHDFVDKMLEHNRPEHGTPRYWEVYFKVIDFLVWRERDHHPLWRYKPYEEA